MAINLHGLFNAKAILLEEQQWCFLTHSWEDKGVHTFPKGICMKVNIIARLEFKLTYNDSTVHRFNYYTTRIPPIALLDRASVQLFFHIVSTICKAILLAIIKSLNDTALLSCQMPFCQTANQQLYVTRQKRYKLLALMFSLYCLTTNIYLWPGVTTYESIRPYFPSVPYWI